MKYQAIKGVKDILPKDIGKWHFLEKTAKELFETFCYYEIRVPVFEKTAVFSRSIGEDTDIVEKEMYTFKDKGDESITLTPSRAPFLNKVCGSGIETLYSGSLILNSYIFQQISW